MSDTMQAKMVGDALLIALWRRGKLSSVMHYSDQGSQYTTNDFQQLLKAQGIARSMSRRGECWDTQFKISLSAAFGLTRAQTYRIHPAG